MKYVSTRGRAPAVDFETALLAGLAPDGGLYMPESWPSFSVEEARAIGSLPYAQAAAEILSRFAGDSFDKHQLAAMTKEAYASLTDDAVAPVTPLGGDDYMLELFHVRRHRLGGD